MADPIDIRQRIATRRNGRWQLYAVDQGNGTFHVEDDFGATVDYIELHDGLAATGKWLGWSRDETLEWMICGFFPQASYIFVDHVDGEPLLILFDMPTDRATWVINQAMWGHEPQLEPIPRN